MLFEKNRVAKSKAKPKVTFPWDSFKRNREASQRSEPSKKLPPITINVNFHFNIENIPTDFTIPNVAMSEQNESAAWPKADAALTQVRKPFRPE